MWSNNINLYVNSNIGSGTREVVWRKNMLLRWVRIWSQLIFSSGWLWVDGWLNKYHWQPNSVCILRKNRQTAKTTDMGGYYNANKNLTLTAIEHMWHGTPAFTPCGGEWRLRSNQIILVAYLNEHPPGGSPNKYSILSVHSLYKNQSQMGKLWGLTRNDAKKASPWDTTHLSSPWFLLQHQLRFLLLLKTKNTGGLISITPQYIQEEQSSSVTWHRSRSTICN